MQSCLLCRLSGQKLVGGKARTMDGTFLTSLSLQPCFAALSRACRRAQCHTHAAFATMHCSSSLVPWQIQLECLGIGSLCPVNCIPWTASTFKNSWLSQICKAQPRSLGGCVQGSGKGAIEGGWCHVRVFLATSGRASGRLSHQRWKEKAQRRAFKSSRRKITTLEREAKSGRWSTCDWGLESRKLVERIKYNKKK